MLLYQKPSEKYLDKATAVVLLEYPGKYGGRILSGFGTGREAHIVERETKKRPTS
jgi:hypothetical protein